MDRGIGGTLEGPASYFMKSPPVQHPDAVAHELTEAFIRGESGAVPAPAEAQTASEPTPA
jgi:myo-inositol-1-phosphate synthase